jgi:hypothetical protein
MKYLKKGKPAKSDKNEPLIVDEANKAYKVNGTIMAVWNMCDGKRTQEQLVDDLANETKIEKAKISEILADVLPKLEQVGLVQKV